MWWSQPINYLNFHRPPGWNSLSVCLCLCRLRHAKTMYWMTPCRPAVRCGEGESFPLTPGRGSYRATTVGHFCSALCQSNKFLWWCWSVSICNMTITIFNSSGENFVSDPGLECTTSSPSLNFSGCHPEDIVQNKEFFIANLAIVILIGAPANLVTLMALPYVRLRWHISHLKYTKYLTGSKYKLKTVHQVPR